MHECPEAVLSLLERIENRLERIEHRLANPPATPRAIRARKRHEAIFLAGELLGRNAEAARKLRRLITGAAVSHDPELARLVAELRRDPETPTSERRLWSLLRHPGGEPPEK